MRRAAALLVAALAVCAAAPARAEGVIQNRKHRLAHELSLGAAVLPLDPFAKGVGGTGRYAFHFDDFHAVEAGATAAYNFDSDLTEQLLKRFAVPRAQLPAMQLMLDVDYVLKPLYGKFTVANRALVYQELYVAAGGSVTSWTDGSLRVGPNVGGGVRFFLGEGVSLRFDLRQSLVARGVPVLDKKAAVDGILYLGGALALSLGGG